MNQENETFQQRIQQGYLTIAKQHQLPVISASDNKDVVADKIMRLIL
ncbi:MAG: hypothetical protein ACHQTE_00810 [Candidatus Saccharimonadales bacterium]